MGSFYFSGIKELYAELKKNTQVIIKVLVGLNIDKLNYKLIEYADLDDQSGHLSNEEISHKYFDSIKRFINSEQFDTHQFYEQSDFFVGLIKKNQLLSEKLSTLIMRNYIFLN